GARMHAVELHHDEDVETIALDQPLERDWQALNQAMLPTCHVRLQTVELQALPARPKRATVEQQSLASSVLGRVDATIGRRRPDERHLSFTLVGYVAPGVRTQRANAGASSTDFDLDESGQS